MAEFNLLEAFGPDYLVGLDRLALSELRAKRDSCTRLETELSYLRRLAQARIDLVMAEADARTSGRFGDLVDRLPQILGDHERPDSPGRLTAIFAPAEGVQVDLSARVEAVLPSDRLGSLAEMDQGSLDQALADLTALEREVSAERRGLHDILDRLQEEVVRRYRSGEATVDALLA
jgi:hypothetical protein